MCLFQGETPLPGDIDCDACALRAHHLLSDILEEASIVSLQTVFMLVSHRLYPGLEIQVLHVFHQLPDALSTPNRPELSSLHYQFNHYTIILLTTAPE